MTEEETFLSDLRDEFALGAMAAMISKQGVPRNAGEQQKVASLAYSMADAMLTERARKR